MVCKDFESVIAVISQSAGHSPLTLLHYSSTSTPLASPPTNCSVFRLIMLSTPCTHATHLHTLVSQAKTTLVLLSEDGSLRIYLASNNSETKYWVQPQFQASSPLATLQPQGRRMTKEGGWAGSRCGRAGAVGGVGGVGQQMWEGRGSRGLGRVGSRCGRALVHTPAVSMCSTLCTHLQ